MISELDVNDVDLPADTRQRDSAVAQRVDEYLSCVFSEIKPIAVINWGYSDRWTWLDMFHKRADGLPLRPLAFDANLDRKPMWDVIAKHLRKG